MALETLRTAQAEAAQMMSINPAEVDATQGQEVYHGIVTMPDGQTLDAFRVLTGQPNRIGKGGIRFSTYPDSSSAETEARELSAEMLSKIAARNLHDVFRGGKGVVNIAERRLSTTDKEHLAREFETLMEEFYLASPWRDVPAGDVGTNGLSDIYYAEYARRHPSDPFAKAVITGKSPENGGLDARAGATGLGVLAAQHALMEWHGVDTATVGLQGFGNVASWYSYFAHADDQRRVRVQAISEREGILWTADPAGFPITEDMVRRIGDNKDWTGSKLSALAEAIESTHPGFDLSVSGKSGDIISFGCDYFVPAAMGNVITGNNVDQLGARRGVIEAGNGTTTPAAHRRMLERGLHVVPDIGANSGGVAASVEEWQTDIAMARGEIAQPPSRQRVEDSLYTSSTELTQFAIQAAEKLGTTDLRVAMAALAINRILGRGEI